MKHLWEYDHPYYCSDSEYHTGGDDNWGQVEHASWQDFIEAWAGLDADLNLLFRWDWRLPSEDGEGGLYLYFMLQRKGLFVPIVVRNMQPEDEPAVLAYLRAHAKTIAAIWEPVSVAAAGGR